MNADVLASAREWLLHPVIAAHATWCHDDGCPVGMVVTLVAYGDQRDAEALSLHLSAGMPAPRLVLPHEAIAERIILTLDRMRQAGRCPAGLHDLLDRYEAARPA